MTAPGRFDLAKSLDAERGRVELGGVVYHANAERPVSGPMAPLLGPRFPLERLKRSSWYPEVDEEERAVASLVRAYPVTGLLGARVGCARDGELADRLAELVEERCPGHTLRVDGKRLTGPLRKCGLVHTSVDAPADETTGQPMALELYGELVELDGRPIGPGVGAWFDAWRGRQGEDYDLVEVAEAFTVELRAATYANVLYPGIDVPLYM